jgi:hypothetical protein
MGRKAAPFDKADRKDDSTEFLRLSAADKLNRNMDVVDEATLLIRTKSTNDSYYYLAFILITIIHE